MLFVVVDAYENYPVIVQQLTQKFEAGQHHAQPFVVAGEVFAVNRYAEPFLHHRRIDFVVVSPAFAAGVVGRVNVDALHPAGVGGQQRLQRLEVVAVDDEIVVQPHLVREAPVPLGHQFVILDREMIILDERFPFEIECGHVSRGCSRHRDDGNSKKEEARLNVP